jgi:hypothetical protein
MQIMIWKRSARPRMGEEPEIMGNMNMGNIWETVWETLTKKGCVFVV